MEASHCRLVSLQSTLLAGGEGPRGHGAGCAGQGEEVQEKPLLIPGPAPKALSEGLGTPVLVVAAESLGSVTQSSWTI